MSTRVLALGYAAVMIAAAAVDVWWESASPCAVIIAGGVTALAVIVGVQRYRPVRTRPWTCLAAAVLLNSAARVE